MPTKVDICNIALSRLNTNPIQALGESTQAGYECNLHYDRALKATLRAYPWNFCTFTQSLGLLPDTYTGWTYAYQYPSDCLKALNIEPESVALTKDSEKIEFEVRLNKDKTGRVILTDEEDAVLRYIAFIDDPNRYDDIFIDAMSWKLASELVPALRGDLNLQVQYINRFQAIVLQAQSVDSSEGREDPDTSNTFVDARA